MIAQTNRVGALACGTGSGQVLETVGFRLRSVRRRFDLTQTQLAQTFSISPRSVSLYESDKRPLPVALAVRIVERFNEDLTWLLTGRRPGVSKEAYDVIAQVVAAVAQKTTSLDLGFSNARFGTVVAYVVDRVLTGGLRIPDAVDQTLRLLDDDNSFPPDQPGATERRGGL